MISPIIDEKMAKFLQSKLILKFFAALLAAIGSFGFVGEAAAQTNGAVEFDFQSQPLFNELNLLPGGMVSRWIEVKNNTNAPRQIGLKLYDVADDNIGVLGLEKFSSKFRFDVKKNGASILPGGAVPLKTLFDGDAPSLETLSAGDSTTYYFELAFDASAGNDYQGKSLGFSLCVLIDGECATGADEPNQTPQTLITRAGGGIGGGRALAPLVFSNHEVQTFCRADGTATAMFIWKTDAPSVGRALYAPRGLAKFDPSFLPDFGWNATAWGSLPVTWHAGFAFGLVSGQAYEWRLDMSSDKGRLTTQSLGSFVAPGCVLGAADEKNDEDILKDVMGVATGVLGEMTDEEVARFLANLRVKNQNQSSGGGKFSNKIAAAGFAPSVLAASATSAQNSSQSSGGNSAATIVFALLSAASFAGWILVKRFGRE